MRRTKQAVMLGRVRTVAPGRATAGTFGFEWMSFSGRVQLSGAEEVLRPPTSFWAALAALDRDAVRSGLGRTARTGIPLELACRLDTRSGPRTFLLKGERIAGESGMAPRVKGVLLEQHGLEGEEAAGWSDPSALDPEPRDALAALVEGRARGVGEDPAQGDAGAGLRGGQGGAAA